MLEKLHASKSLRSPGEDATPTMNRIQRCY